ncbi:4937_t:CDS:2, partial [Gigaspora rosea]
MSIQNHKRQLLALGTIDQKLHYGPFATNWWVFSKLKTDQNKKSIPIRINIRIKFELNQKEFIIRVVDNNWKPGYTWFSGPSILGFDNEVVAKQLYIYYQENKIHTYSRKFPNDVWAKSSILKNYNGKDLFGLCDQLVIQAIQTHITIPYCKACDWNNIEIMTHAFEKHLKRRISVVNLDWYQFLTKWKQQSTTIIEFSSHLASIYLADFFWTCAEDPSSDRAIILYFYTKNLLTDIPYDPLQSELSIANKNLQNKVDQFWNCLDTSIKINKHEKLKISTDLMDPARQYSRINGP